jgi:hypothetical protein
MGKLHSISYFHHADILFGLLFNPEDGGDISLRNVRWLSVAFLSHETTRLALGLFFDPENGGDMFLRNSGTRRIQEESTVHNHRCDNLKLYPRRYNSGYETMTVTCCLVCWLCTVSCACAAWWYNGTTPKWTVCQHCHLAVPEWRLCNGTESTSSML